MSFWREMGLLRRDDNKCFHSAFLLSRSEFEIKEIPFKFSYISEETIADTSSVMPMTFDKKSKSIFVYDYELPFVTGARIKFADGETFTITSITEVRNEDKSQFDNNGIIGLNLLLGD